MNMDDASCMGIPHPPYWHSFPLATYPCFGEVCRYGGEFERQGYHSLAFDSSRWQVGGCYPSLMRAC